MELLVWTSVKESTRLDTDTDLARSLCLARSLFPRSQLFAPMPYLMLNQVPEMINRFLTVADPITITYPLRLDVERHVHPKVFDIEVEIDDPAMKGPKGNSVLNTFMEEGGKEILLLDEEVRLQA